MPQSCLLMSFQEGPHQNFSASKMAKLVHIKYVITGKLLATHFEISSLESLRRRKNEKKVKMKGGQGWIRGLRGQEQDMSSLAL